MGIKVDYYDMSRAERGLNFMIVWQPVKHDRKVRLFPIFYFVLRIESGVRVERFEAALSYCLRNSTKSETWMLDTLRPIGLLTDYTVAWLPYIQHASNQRSTEASLFRILERFAKAFLDGTSVIKDGKSEDGLGLYWLPRSQTSAKEGIKRLTAFLTSDVNESDSWRMAARPRGDTDYMAGIRMAHRYVVQSKKSLLAHLRKRTPERAPQQAFGHIFTTVPVSAETYRFPAKYVWRFLDEGFERGRRGEVDETAQLIAWVLFAGGPRYSEPLHAWVQDVQFVDDEPIMFIHHPREGVLYDESGLRTIRASHLAKKTRIPRNELRKRGHSGFKGMDGEQLIWLPIEGLVDELSRRFRHYLTVTRPRIMRLRKAQGLKDHDYLFVGSGHKFADNTNPVGAPYTREAFRSAWKRAVKRCSVLVDDPDLRGSKKLGTTPHGARHFYGTFLKTIGCDGDVIQKCMHHRSPFSHLRYTNLTASEINSILRRSGGAAVDKQSMKTEVSEALRRQISRPRFR